MKFKYDTALTPSGPTVELAVTGPSGKTSVEKGIIDTGAGITALPSRLVKRLHLKSNGTAYIAGAFSTRRVYTYAADILVGGIKFKSLKVFPLNHEAVLIGRNLINLWVLTLDGKNKVFDIDAWSTSAQDASADTRPASRQRGTE